MANRTLALVGLMAASLSAAAQSTTADFNGDGFTDIAVGHPAMANGGISSAGEVTVIHGGAGGLIATNGTAVAQQFRAGSGGVPGSAGPSNRFGFALASGDFNDDGFDDLVIGSPGVDVTRSFPNCQPLFGNCGPYPDAGAVHVIHGSPSGLSASLTGALAPRLLLNPNPTSEGENFGWSLAAGDFNGDGITDLAVGAPRWDQVNYLTGSRIDSAGVVRILLGNRTSGLSTAGSVGIGQGPLLDDPEAGDHFGHTLVAGDFDADGHDDLAVSVILEDVLVQGVQVVDAGAVAVVMGSASGLTTAGNQFWHQNSPGLDTFNPATIGQEVEDNDKFGTTLAAGDFNGDGMDDLAVGTPGEDIFHQNDAVNDEEANGLVHVLLGGHNGLSATGSRAIAQSDFGGIGEAEDLFGSSLAAGDFNNDNFTDLAIGATGETPDPPGLPANSGPADAGEVKVLFGSAGGLGTGGLATFTLFGTQPEEFMPAALTAGNVGGPGGSSGPDDLVVGSSGFDLGINFQNAGRVLALLGQADSTPLVGGGTESVTRDTPGVPGTVAPGDAFGQRFE